MTAMAWAVVVLSVRDADEAERVRLVAERGGNEDGNWDDNEAFFVGLHAPGSRLRIARSDLTLVIAGLACTSLGSILGALGEG